MLTISVSQLVGSVEKGDWQTCAGTATCPAHSPPLPPLPPMLPTPAAQDALGTCERILRTPIPLGYTRHTSRFLMIWWGAAGHVAFCCF